MHCACNALLQTNNKTKTKAFCVKCHAVTKLNAGAMFNMTLVVFKLKI